MRTQLLNRWLFGSKTGDAVIKPQIAESDEKIVTFLDFVQAIAIRSIRSQYAGLSLHKIRQAVDQAKKLCNVDYPFAMKHRTFVFLRQEPGSAASDDPQDDDPEPSCEIILDGVQLTGKRSGNRIIREVAEVYMSDITYDSRGLASEYTAMRLGDLSVVMNPKNRFGEPLCRVATRRRPFWTPRRPRQCRRSLQSVRSGSQGG